MPVRRQALPLPSFEHNEDEVRAFRAAQKWIVRHSEGRSRRRPERHRVSPNEAWLGFLKRHSYALITHYIVNGDVRVFERIIRYENRHLPTQVRIDENPFFLGLLALYPPGEAEMITRYDRSAYSVQMLYAYRHRVPANLLVGFIFQSGSLPKVRDGLKRGYMEEGFETLFNEDIWSGATSKPQVLAPGTIWNAEDDGGDDVDLSGDAALA